MEARSYSRQMGRGSDEIATVVSSNALSLQPPYEGKQNATFSLRSLRGENNEFVVAVEKGQIICEQDGCGLLVRVDDEKAFRLIDLILKMEAQIWSLVQLIQKI
jgi:hypothetical protein